MSAGPSPLKHTSSIGSSSGSSIFRTGLSSSSLRAKPTTSISAAASTAHSAHVAPTVPSHVNSITPSHVEPRSLAAPSSTATGASAGALPSSKLQLAPSRSIYDKPRAIQKAAIPVVSQPAQSLANASPAPKPAVLFSEDPAVPALLSDAQWAALHFTEAVNFSDFSVVGDMGSNCAVSVSAGNSTSTSNSTGSNGAVRNLPSIFEILDHDPIEIPAPTMKGPSATAISSATSESAVAPHAAPSAPQADLSKPSRPNAAAVGNAIPPSVTNPVVRTTSNPFMSRTSSRIAPQPAFPRAQADSPSVSVASPATVTVSTPVTSLNPIISTAPNVMPAIAPVPATDFQALYLASLAQTERMKQELAMKDAEKNKMVETFAEKEKKFGALQRSLENSSSMQADKLAAAKAELEKQTVHLETLKSQLDFARLESVSPAKSSNSSNQHAFGLSAPHMSPSTPSPGQPPSDALSKKRSHPSITPAPSSALPPPSLTSSTFSLNPSKGARAVEERAQKLLKLRESMPLIHSFVSPSQSASTGLIGDIEVGHSLRTRHSLIGADFLAIDPTTHAWTLLTSPSGPYAWLQSNGHLFATFQDLSASFSALQAQVASFQHRRLSLSMKSALLSELQSAQMRLSNPDSDHSMDPTSLQAELVDFALMQSGTLLALFSSLFSFSQLLVSSIFYQESQKSHQAEAPPETMHLTSAASSRMKVDSVVTTLSPASFCIPERQALVYTLRMLAAVGTSDSLSRALLLLPPPSDLAISSSKKASTLQRALSELEGACTDLFGTLSTWMEALQFAPSASAVTSSIAPTAVIGASPSVSHLSYRDKSSSGSVGDSNLGTNNPFHKELAPLAREILEPLLHLASEVLSELPLCASLAEPPHERSETLHSLSTQEILRFAHGTSLERVAPTLSALNLAVGGFLSSDAFVRCLCLQDGRESTGKCFPLAALALSATEQIASVTSIPINLASILRQSQSILLSGWSIGWPSEETSGSWLPGISSSGIPMCTCERDYIALGMSNRLQLARLVSVLADHRADVFGHALNSYASASAQNSSSEVDLGAQLVLSLMLAIEEGSSLILKTWIAGPQAGLSETSSINSQTSTGLRPSSYYLESLSVHSFLPWLISGSSSPADMSMFSDSLNFIHEASTLVTRIIRLHPKYSLLTRSTEPELWTAYRSLEVFLSYLTSFELIAGHLAPEPREASDSISPPKLSPLVSWIRNRLPSCIDRLNSVLEDLSVIQNRLARSD